MDVGFELRKCILRHVPDDIEVDTHVVVHESIPRARHAAPNNVGVSSAQIGGQSFRCFADNLQLPDHSVLVHGLGKESLLPDGDVPFDFVDRIKDVLEVKQVPVHRGLASRMISSRM